MKNIPVNIQYLILKPINLVFKAIIDRDQISNYFTTEASSNLIEGKKVIWKWEDVGAQLEVEVLKVIENQMVVFKWQATGKPTKVTIELKAKEPNKTELHISEGTFTFSEEDVPKAIQQTQGWTDFVCCLKGFLYTGANLRTGKT